MQTFQEILDTYGYLKGCKNWSGWVAECIQHSDMVFDKFIQLKEEFEASNKKQFTECFEKLKTQTMVKKNWSRNEHEYLKLLKTIN